MNTDFLYGFQFLFSADLLVFGSTVISRIFSILIPKLSGDSMNSCFDGLEIINTVKMGRKLGISTNASWVEVSWLNLWWRWDLRGNGLKRAPRSRASTTVCLYFGSLLRDVKLHDRQTPLYVKQLNHGDDFITKSLFSLYFDSFFAEIWFNHWLQIIF